VAPHADPHRTLRSAAIPSRREIFFRPAGASGCITGEAPALHGVTRGGKLCSLPCSDSIHVSTDCEGHVATDEGQLILFVQRYEELHSFKYPNYSNLQRWEKIWEETGQLVKRPSKL
jgi:hypothetical protein